MKHKKLFIALTAVCSVIVFFAVFIMIWYFGDNYKDFEGFRKEFEIAGLDDGAVPQGMTACPATYLVYNEEVQKPEAKNQQYFFVSAYMADGSPSRIYVTGEKTGLVGYVTMKTEEGEDFYGHCGGIAINNTLGSVTTSSALSYTLWVTGESKVYCAKASETFVSNRKTIAQEIIDKAAARTAIENGEETETAESADECFITFTSSFNANCNASFCYYYDDPSSSGISSDKLYVGEFYRSGNYETDKMHWLTSPSGYQNTAFMYEYSVNSSSSNEFGLTPISNEDVKPEDLVPKIQKIFSLPEKIQGMAYSGKPAYGTNSGLMVLSESYGLSNSHLLCFDVAKVMATGKRYNDVAGESFVYDGVKKTFGNEQVNYSDSSLYVYYVDKNDETMFVNDYSVPCMSEGLCLLTPTTSGNAASKRVYVLFESAGKKYKAFVRQQVKNVYSFIPTDK